MVKKIIVGEIEDYFWDDDRNPPVKLFKKACEMSKWEDWILYTNNPQFIEALEVLCGENNIEIYLRLNGKCKEVDFYDAYNYLGDVYDIINRIRLRKDLDKEITDEWISNQIKDYKRKYLEIMGDEKLLKIKRLKSADPISYDEWVELHNEVDGEM